MDGSRVSSSSAAAAGSWPTSCGTSAAPCGGIVMRSPLTARLPTLDGERVQPAFGLPGAAPPPRALGFPRYRGSRARPATDARVALIEQGVVWDSVLSDVAPHIGPVPMGEREHLDDRASRDLVEFDELRRDAGGGLILPHCADPGVESDDGPLERRDRAGEATAVGIGLVEPARGGERRELHEVGARLLDAALRES